MVLGALGVLGFGFGALGVEGFFFESLKPRSKRFLHVGLEDGS